MQAGKLKQRVTIEQPVAGTRSGLGTPTTWASVATVWASVEPLQGREYLAAQQAQSEVTTRVRLRYLAGITAAMRINHGGTIYNIVSPPINPNLRNQELILMCAQQTEGA